MRTFLAPSVVQFPQNKAKLLPHLGELHPYRTARWGVYCEDFIRNNKYKHLLEKKPGVGQATQAFSPLLRHPGGISVLCSLTLVNVIFAIIVEQIEQTLKYN